MRSRAVRGAESSARKVLDSTFRRRCRRPTRPQEGADLGGALRPGVDAVAFDARQVADEVARLLHRLEHAVAIAHQDRGLAQAVRVLGRVRDQEVAATKRRRASSSSGGEALALGGGQVLAGLEGEREVVALDDGARVAWKRSRASPTTRRDRRAARKRSGSDGQRLPSPRSHSLRCCSSALPVTLK